MGPAGLLSDRVHARRHASTCLHSSLHDFPGGGFHQRDRCRSHLQHRPAGCDFLRHLETTVRRADARGNLMFDAQIAALCREHGIAAILTNDRDFERFDKLQVRYLDEVSDHGDKG